MRSSSRSHRRSADRPPPPGILLPVRAPRSLLAALVVALVALTGCRLDVSVELTIDPDGTGELVVSAVADAELVERKPGLADDLRLEDAVAAGWVVEGPTTPEEGGGLTLTLRHPVTSAAEATNLLASLGPPFAGVTLERTLGPEGSKEATTTLSGQLQLTGGFDAFADSDLLAAVGGTPFAADIAATGATPAESVSVTFRADLPGDVESTTADGGDGVLEWQAPLDGRGVDLATTTAQRPESASGWAGPVATLALVLLVVWVLVSVVVIVLVVRARQRRGRRRPLLR